MEMNKEHQAADGSDGYEVDPNLGAPAKRYIGRQIWMVVDNTTILKSANA